MLTSAISRWTRFAKLVGLALVTALPLVLLGPPPSSADRLVERVLGTGTVDAAGVAGPKQQIVPFTTSSDLVGPATFTLRWSNLARLQIEIRNAAGVVIGSELTRTKGEKRITLTLAAGTNYSARIWSTYLAGTYTLSVVETLQDLAPPLGRPNIIVVNTDDQRTDTMAYLPKVRQWMEQGGTYFPNAYVSTPSCCPSRATLMSGQYVHNNRQYQHLATGFDLNLTTQRFLKDAGYFTGHSGKFLHWLPLTTRAPYWDRWMYFKGGYYDVPMMIDSSYVKQQSNTTVVSFDRAINYIQDFNTRKDAQPFYLHVAPIAPHSPTTAEPKYATANVPAMVNTPDQFETDRSDKPPHVRDRSTSLSTSMSTRAAQIRTLYTVDDSFDKMMLALQAAGELDNTLVIFTSDNGYLWSEHGLKSKFRPYPPSVKVPFYLRWPGKVAAGAVDQRFVTHVDVAPTLLAAAQTTQNLSTFDGYDILGAHSRQRAYTEYYYDTGNNNGIPTWASITTPTYQYVEYYGLSNAMTQVSFREYYDMVNDPYQLVNLYNDGNPTNDPNTATLSAALASAKTCVGTACP